MKLVLDVETTFQVTDRGKRDPSPFNPNNFLVSVGWKWLDADETDYAFFRHNDLTQYDATARARVQAALDKATLLIAHNAKFDLLWLKESGFTYDGPVWDTMVFEYIYARGVKRSLNLHDVLIRRECDSVKRTDLTQEYLDKNIGFEAMPVAVVEEYGIADVVSTGELYQKQQEILAEERNVGLGPTIEMSNEFLLALTDTEINGIRIDMEALDEAEKQLLAEKAELEAQVRHIVSEVMGDRPINIASSEQLSMVVYSRKVVDKKKWAETFNIGTEFRGATKKPKRRPRMSRAEFASAVRENTEVLLVQTASQCDACKGVGSVYRTKKNGESYKRPSSCSGCGGCGVVYHDTRTIAGLKCVPRNVFDAAAGGFATDKDTLAYLAKVAKNDKAKTFLNAIVRLNAVDVYLTSFVGGIRRNVRDDLILHTSFNQCVTATGRLSSSDPNFQNLPRAKTFPIRGTIMSRFEGGEVIEADFAQLEYRTAVFQGDDKYGRKAIADRIDAHKFTADTLTNAGQPTDRQAAKPHTFKPLYGGTSGTEAEQTYYKAFIDTHEGIKSWHDNLQDQAIKYKRITIPTGREYAFPGAERTRWGGSTFATQIKNYPVQGLATADIVPVAFIEVWKAMKAAKLRSLLILTVHDSILIDCYPGEREQVLEILLNMCRVPEVLYSRYKFVFDVPLGVEAKGGPNWRDTKVIGEREFLFTDPLTLDSSNTT